MAAPQKKAARVNSSRGTNDRNPDKGEVGGLSPPRPTMNYQNSIYAVIFTFILSEVPHKASCQACVNFRSARMEALGLPVTIACASTCSAPQRRLMKLRLCLVHKSA